MYSKSHFSIFTISSGSHFRRIAYFNILPYLQGQSILTWLLP